MATGLKVFSKEEVASHNTAESCWIIIDDKVYDVSKFLSEHPGGEEVITEIGGQDATDAFNDVGHSRDAKEMAEEYLIGALHKDSSAAPVKESKSSVSSKPCGCFIQDVLLSPTWTNFLIPTAIGIAVYIIYKGAMRLFTH